MKTKFNIKKWKGIAIKEQDKKIFVQGFENVHFPVLQFFLAASGWLKKKQIYLVNEMRDNKIRMTFKYC